MAGGGRDDLPPPPSGAGIAPQARVHPPPVMAPPPPPPIEAPRLAASATVAASPAVGTWPAPSGAPATANGAAPPPPVESRPAVEVPPPAPMAPPEPAAPVGVVDPHDLGPASMRLSAAALRTGRVALGILTMVLAPDEKVESLVGGRYQNEAGVAALTSTRLILVNEHEWVPDVRIVELTPDLVVQGWQDDRTASLIFITEGQSVSFSFIVDRPLAQEMAQLVRARVAALTA